MWITDHLDMHWLLVGPYILMEHLLRTLQNFKHRIIIQIQVLKYFDLAVLFTSYITVPLENVSLLCVHYNWMLRCVLQHYGRTKDDMNIILFIYLFLKED